jgi:hypothetical protein
MDEILCRRVRYLFSKYIGVKIWIIHQVVPNKMEKFTTRKHTSKQSNNNAIKITNANES